MILLSSCVALFWLFVFIADVSFKFILWSPYLRLLEGGLSIRPGCVQWHTSRWNQVFHRWRRWYPKWQDCWFTLGSIVSCCLVPLATFMLMKSIFAFFFPNSTSATSEQVLQPVLPGANVPLSDIPYYLLTLLFCSIVHEMGHAMCAAREDVGVCGVGIFLMGIFPGAFVELSTEQVTNSSACQRLRVFCAGVWHNLTLVGLSLALLSFSPLFLAPGYVQNQGLLVQYVDQNSGLAGPAGLSVGDILVNVANCNVSSNENWISCLRLVSQELPEGFCVSQSFLQEHHYTTRTSSENPACCSPTDASGLCFALDDNDLSLQCLPVRKLLERTPLNCQSSKNCSSLDVCAKPLLANGSQLLQLHRLHKKPVLFLGSVFELARSVHLSPFVPRNSLWPASLPYIFETQLKYLIAFSSALALLNVVPCYGLDGYYILSAFLDWLGFFSSRRRKTLLTLFSTAGTLLLGTSVMCALYVFVQR